MVDLDGGKPQALETGNRADLTDEPRQRIAGIAVPVTPEIDPGQDDLSVALGNATTDLLQHRGDGPAA